MAKGQKKVVVVIGVILACIGFIYAARAFVQFPGSQKDNAAHARRKGPSNAPIKIVEYIDFQCPACATGSLFLSDLLGKHPLKISVELKYYPLGNVHRHAYLSAGYAECAARQGKFWQFQDLLIQRQKEWSELPNAQEAFEKMAKEVSLDLTKLTVCLGDDSVDKVITEEKSKGSSLGIKSTPTYFINETMVVGAKSLKEELDKLLRGEKY